MSNRSEQSSTLTFPTAQLGDVVLERAGSERYRWSVGLVFAQVVSERRLDPGAAWTIPLEGVLDVEPGPYEAVGILTCLPAPPPVRVAVAVEAAAGSRADPAR